MYAGNKAMERNVPFQVAWGSDRQNLLALDHPNKEMAQGKSAPQIHCLHFSYAAINVCYAVDCFVLLFCASLPFLAHIISFCISVNFYFNDCIK